MANRREDAARAAKEARLLERGTRLLDQTKHGSLPPLLALSPPRNIEWAHLHAFDIGSSKRVELAEQRRKLESLLNSGTVVWALRLEGTPRPWEESGADQYIYVWRHPSTHEVRLGYFDTMLSDATVLMTLMFPLVVDLKTGEHLPWAGFGIDVRLTEERAGIRPTRGGPLPGR